MILKLRNKNKPQLNLSGPVPAVFGIVNLTPDSFSDGGKYPDAEAAVQEALRMFEAGAAGVDLGAESTRPGAAEVPKAEDDQLPDEAPVQTDAVIPETENPAPETGADNGANDSEPQA